MPKGHQQQDERIPVRRQAAAVLAAIALTVVISGCGRRGPLEPPPGTLSVPPAAAGTQDEAVEPTVPDRPFILDALI